MTGAVAAAAGLLIAAGILAILHGVRRTTPRPRSASSLADQWAWLTRRPAGAAGRRRDAILVGSVVAGFAVTALTGWLIALVALPAIALGLPPLLTVPKPRDVDLLEALDRWVRALAATLSTGKSITDAIRISRRTAPPLIADEVALLVARLNNRWETADALHRFADELDSPDADGVIAALILATNRGGTGASATLRALADSVQAQLKARRVIEVERAKPYVVVRQVTIITLATLVLVAVLSPTFFAPYKTPVGQVMLALLAVAYAGSLVLMRRRARQQARARILVRESP